MGVFVRDVSASNCAEGHVEGVDHESDRNEQENTKLLTFIQSSNEDNALLIPGSPAAPLEPRLNSNKPRVVRWQTATPNILLDANHCPNGLLSICRSFSDASEALKSDLDETEPDRSSAPRTRSKSSLSQAYPHVFVVRDMQ